MDLTNMTNEQFVRIMRAQGACEDAVAWAKVHGGTPQEMWRDCPRGDWLAWFIRQNLETLGYTLQDWAGALAEAVENGDYTDNALASVLKSYARGMSPIEEAVVAGWPYGLTIDLNIPNGRWMFLSESVQVWRDRFPLFEEEQ